jgi:hypothetical protein
LIDSDQPEFARLLKATMELYAQNPTRDATALWWASLRRYTLDQVRAAFSAHIQDPLRGRFTPKPADLIAALAETDGRPNADEAWSHCPRSEAQTSVWTAETRAAFFEAAFGLIDDDPIAARMAFKGAYERHIAQARRELRTIEWEVSLGHDLHGRRPVIDQAVQLGRISSEHAQSLLPPPEGPVNRTIAKITQGIGRIVN